MKNFFMLLAVAALFSVGVYAQGESSSKKSKTATPPPAATTTAPATTAGTPAASDGKKSKAPATTTTPAAKPAGKMMKGVVVDITDWVSGGAGKVNKEQASKALASGHVLGLMIGSKVYMVSNADGSSAMQKLSGFAGGNVGVTGTTKSKGGYNLLIVNMMENI